MDKRAPPAPTRVDPRGPPPPAAGDRRAPPAPVRRGREGSREGLGSSGGAEEGLTSPGEDRREGKGMPPGKGLAGGRGGGVGWIETTERERELCSCLLYLFFVLMVCRLCSASLVS